MCNLGRPISISMVVSRMIHKDIYLETDRYIYSNWLTRSITLLGHRVCAGLRRFDASGNLVLDIGCGSGIHFRYIRNANFIGIDSMPEMIERSKRNLSDHRGSILEMDLYQIALPNHSVDSIIASGILEHLDKLEGALVEIDRVLKVRGELIVLQACEGLLYRLGRRFTTQRHTGPDYKEYLRREHIHSCWEVLDLLGKNFRQDKLVGVPFGIPSIELNAYIAGRYVKC